MDCRIQVFFTSILPINVFFSVLFLLLFISSLVKLFPSFDNIKHLSFFIMFYLLFISSVIFGFWTVGLLRIPKKCEGGAKGGAKGDAKEVMLGEVRPNLT